VRVRVCVYVRSIARAAIHIQPTEIEHTPHKQISHAHSLSLIHTYTHTHTHMHTHPHTYTLTLTPTHTHAHDLAHTNKPRTQLPPSLPPDVPAAMIEMMKAEGELRLATLCKFCALGRISQKVSSLLNPVCTITEELTFEKLCLRLSLPFLLGEFQMSCIVILYGELTLNSPYRMTMGWPQSVGSIKL